MSGDGPVEDAYRKVRAAIRSLNDALEMGLEHPGIRLGITKLQQAEDEITRAVRNGPGTSPTHS